MIPEEYENKLIALGIPKEKHTLDYLNTLLPSTLILKGVELDLLVEPRYYFDQGEKINYIMVSYKKGGKRIFQSGRTELVAKAKLLVDLVLMGFLELE